MLTGSLSPTFSTLTALTRLELAGNQFTGHFDADFGRWMKLQRLQLNDNAFSGPLLDINFPLLELLTLQNNRFTGRLDEVFHHDKRYDHLVNVDLSGNMFSGQVPAMLFDIATLETIALSVNCFTGELPTTLCHAERAIVMSLDGLGAAKECENTKGWFLSDVRFSNYLEGTIPACLFNMSRLETLHLNSNGFSGTLPHIDKHLPLVDLRLSHNRLTGSIPLSAQKRQFRELDLSYNRITGQYNDAQILSNSSSTTLKVNRLSGKLPSSSIAAATDLSILLGNMFSCGDDLPGNDEHYEDYDCGSEILDASLGLLAVCTGVVVMLVGVVMWLCCRQGQALYRQGQLCKGYDFQVKGILARFVSLARNQRCYFSVMSELKATPPASLRNVQNVIRFYFELLTVTKLWVLLCLLSTAQHNKL